MGGCGTTLYHGSFMPIEKPDLQHSRQNVDFGKGFYTTNLYEQAQKWCSKHERLGKKGIVCTYTLDDKAFSELKVLSFDTYSEEWLDFILTCRRGNDESDYDIVSGGVANDKVFNTVELYFDGLIEKSEALKRLRFEQPNMQICLRTEQALQFLHYERSEEV